MKSYSNCSNAGEINVDLPNLFCSSCVYLPAMITLTISKIMETLQRRTNSTTIMIVNMMTLNLTMLQGGVNCKIRLISSFHQSDLTEIQVINKSIKGLNRRTIYQIFKAINENKGIQKSHGSGRNSSISKSTFEIIKKCLEIDNGLSTSELSN